MRILATAKQVPSSSEDLLLDSRGTMIREGIALEMNPYCKRAVAKAVELAQLTNGNSMVVSLGPPSAEDILLEALAWGVDEAVLLSDPLFAGSDTLATARALAAFVKKEGPFDLILTGHSSLDSETGQVGAELAELLDLAFADSVRELDLDKDNKLVNLRCEQDDGGRLLSVPLPAVLAVAERLCPPAKVHRDIWSEIPSSRVRKLKADDLDPKGPWGLQGSPTQVGSVRSFGKVPRLLWRLDKPVESQVEDALEILIERKAFEGSLEQTTEQVASPTGKDDQSICVVLEPNREQFNRELLGRAALLAHQIDAKVLAISTEAFNLSQIWKWGTDELVVLNGSKIEQDIAATISCWAQSQSVEIMMFPASYWGREVAARTAARLEAGLIGDAVDIQIENKRLLAFKPANRGSQLVAITAKSKVQMVSVRPGVLPLLLPRSGLQVANMSTLKGVNKSQVQVRKSWRDDNFEDLLNASIVIGLGAGVPNNQYGQIYQLADLLGAQVAATRKVTDKGWIQRSRQVGITGRSISPRLYIAIGISGKYNHLAGVSGAQNIVAINNDPDAVIFSNCDLAIVGNWDEVVSYMIDKIKNNIKINSFSNKTKNKLTSLA